MDLLREITKVKDQDIEFINIVYKNEIRNKKYILGEKSKNKNEISYRFIDDDKKIYTYGKIVKRNV